MPVGGDKREGKGLVTILRRSALQEAEEDEGGDGV